MAIYHLTTRSVSRSDSCSAREATTYILRTGEYARDHDEVVYARSGHMPSFAGDDPLIYWGAADRHERRNGRLYQSIEYALPVELDDNRRRDLAVQFAQRLTVAEQLPFTLAIHRGGGHNPHCHLLISERRNDGIARPRKQWFKRYNAKVPEQGGARKSTSLRPRGWLVDIRKAWADLCNMALESAGHDDRIDHRTLKAQGIAREPGKHLGPVQHKMLKKGIDVSIADDHGMTAADIGPHRTVPRQLEAMGCGWYDVLIPLAPIPHGKTPRQKPIKRTWSRQQIIENLPQLRGLNAKRRDILIRPHHHPLPGMVLVDRLSSNAVRRMKADGLEPTVTLETPGQADEPGEYQVWVRVDEHIPTTRRAAIARYLAEYYGGNTATGANTYGRLAGFTAGPERPYVLVRQSDTSGRNATRAADLMEATRRPAQPEPDAPGPKGGPRAG